MATQWRVPAEIEAYRRLEADITNTAGDKLIKYATEVGCRSGLVGIDKMGRLLCNNNTKAMSWCYIKNGKMKVFNND